MVSVYRIVSKPADQVIGRIIPVVFLLSERQAVCREQSELGKQASSKEERIRALLNFLGACAE